MRACKSVLITLILVFPAIVWVIPAEATIYYQTSLESVACNHEISDDSIDGEVWDTAQNGGPGAAFPFPVVRCTLTPPVGAGTKYVEILTKCTTGYTGAGRCTSSGNEDLVSISAFTDIGIPAHNIVDGRTYYLGAFVRYDRINGRDVWLDSGTPNSWDKTLEFRGRNFRWGIGVGAPQGNYTMTDHKFTFDLWCADTGFTGCQTGGNADHKLQNDNGYDAGTPFLADYERWYAVVIKVTASTSMSGVAELFVNGIRTTNRTSQVTYTSGGTITDIEMWGTIGQAEYATPAHYIFMDRILMSDSLTDMQSAGLMRDPNQSASSDITPPASPTNLRVQ
jgi:hypothetical protein